MRRLQTQHRDGPKDGLDYRAEKPTTGRERVDGIGFRPMERWRLIAELVGDADSVLDIGCRDRELRNHLVCDYVGLDLQPPADVVHSAEAPLPFGDSDFGCVVLADVLEHLDDPYSALDEAMRVGRSVVVLLPNIYTLMLRLRFLSGSLGAKYAFEPENHQDRHRWIMSYSEARQFTHHRASVKGYCVEREVAYCYPFRRRSVRLLHRLVKPLGPDLWGYEYAARLSEHGK